VVGGNVGHAAKGHPAQRRRHCQWAAVPRPERQAVVQDREGLLAQRLAVAGRGVIRTPLRVFFCTDYR
jgi:hypothetical protein